MTLAAAAPIDGPRRAPSHGPADALVVLLHGYGANGDDLFGLAEPLSRVLPRAAFVSPDAPERCRVNPGGYQWFPITWIDGSSEAEMQAGFRRAALTLDAFLDAELARLGLDESRLALFGFSQGAMMALHVGPRRARAPAAVAAFSGRLIAPERLEAEARSKPATLLVHGDRDEVVPASSLAEAQQALSAAGFPVRWRVCRGVGHGIAPEGLELAARFFADTLGGAAT